MHTDCVCLLDVELRSLLVNVSELMSELAKNQSIPADSMNALLSAHINFTEVCPSVCLCVCIVNFDSKYLRN